MKNPIPLAILLGALAGAASAALTTILIDSPAPLASTQQAAGLGAGSDMRLDRLTEQNATLADRLALLESRPVSSDSMRTPAGSGAGVSQANIDEAVGKALAAASAPTRDMDLDQKATWFDQQMTDYQDRKDQQRAAERAQEADERNEKRLDDLTQKLGLNQDQVKSMRTYMTEMDTQRNDMRDLMRSGELPRDEIRGAFEELRKVSDAGIQQILSPAQYQTYQESNSDRGGFGGWTRGGTDSGGDRNRGGGNTNRGGRGGF